MAPLLLPLILWGPPQAQRHLSQHRGLRSFYKTDKYAQRLLFFFWPWKATDRAKEWNQSYPYFMIIILIFFLHCCILDKPLNNSLTHLANTPPPLPRRQHINTCAHTNNITRLPLSQNLPTPSSALIDLFSLFLLFLKHRVAMSCYGRLGLPIKFIGF